MGTEAAPGGRLVLIAEDEPPIAAVLAAVVAEAGHTPLVAGDGRRALELARERRPALLITDLMMPALGGAELIAALRREYGDGLPVVLVTTAPHAWARAAGADVVLPKPFELTHLEALLRRYLDAGA
jgi:CheY-like chemotaxis protein